MKQLLSPLLVAWGFLLQKHSLRLNRRRMRFGVWRLRLIHPLKWRMIFTSLHFRLYPPSYGVPPFDFTTYPSEPPHFEQPRSNAPFLDPHYSPPPVQPSLHELQAEFHALHMDIHDMRDDITSLLGLVDESSDMHSTQISSLHHHHSEMMNVHDRHFMSLETRLDDFETQLDCQDEHFTQILESHREMMDHLRSVFPPPAP